MNAVQKITPHLSNLSAPAVLAEMAQWLIWRFEPNPDPTKKPLKVPYYASGAKRTGQQGTPEDRANLVTFAAARAAASKRGFDGVGFCPMAECNVVALDFDDCMPGGEVLPEIQELLLGTYAEVSPSGKGVRAFFRGQLGNLKSTAKNGQWGIELFSTKGYVTFTGQPLDHVDIMGVADTVQPVTDEVLALVRDRFKREPREASIGITDIDDEPLDLTVSEVREMLAFVPADDYGTWIEMGMACHHQFGGAAIGFKVWDEWSQTCPDKYSRAACEDRWRSFKGGSGAPITARVILARAKFYGANIPSRGAAVVDASAFDPPAEEEDDGAPGSGAATKKAEPKKAAARFEVLKASEFANGPAPTWIIKSLLPRAELIVLFGASGSGKSFMALDMGASIALGLQWRGMKTKQGRVVYVAAEGAAGFRNRMNAYAQANDIPLEQLNENFGVIDATPNLLMKSTPKAESDALALAKSIGKADLIIIDTFAQTTPGANENAAEDMGTALAHCKGIARYTGATVMLVHHSGKDEARGARGWSGIKAAADAQLEVVRIGESRLLRTDKQKDGKDDLVLGFKLDTVTIGMDEDNDPITSCVVKACEVPVVKTSGRKLGALEKMVMDAFGEIAKTQSEGIERTGVIAMVAPLLDAPEGNAKDKRRERVARAISQLCRGDTALLFHDETDDTLELKE